MASIIRNGSLFYTISFIILLAISNSTVQAQEEGFTINGTIWDYESGAPIENVNISVKNSRIGTTSNRLGQFKLNINTLPFYLEISHVSYESKIVEFAHKPMHEVQIYLRPKSETLSEVTVTSMSIDTLFANRIYSVLDYELCDTGIILLIYKARLSRAELWLQDYSGKNQLKMTVLPMKPLALIKDCLGNVHILSKDKSYQVVIESDRFRLLAPYNIAVFQKVMADCKFKIGDKVYFEDFEFNDLVKKYYYIDIEDTSSHLLAVVTDQEKINFLRQNPENYFLGNVDAELNLLSQIRGTTNDKAVLDAIRNMTVELRFNKMAYLSKIYAPAYPLQDSIAIFNHPNNIIEFYNSCDSLIGTTGIDYHHPEKEDKYSTLVYAFAKSSKWLQEIYVDEIKNKAYTIYQNINGTRNLTEIDLNSGEVSYRLNIPFPYVQKIKVRNDFVYYVYKGYGEGQRKKLFRQRID